MNSFKALKMQMEFTVCPAKIQLLKMISRESKKVITMSFILQAWTLAFTGPGTPFFSLCLDCYLVSGVCLERADLLSIVMMQSMKDLPSFLIRPMHDYY
jgi:hypothetical protein